MKIHGDGVQKFQNLHNEQISIMYKKQTNKKPTSSKKELYKTLHRLHKSRQCVGLNYV